MRLPLRHSGAGWEEAAAYSHPIWSVCLNAYQSLDGRKPTVGPAGAEVNARVMLLVCGVVLAQISCSAANSEQVLLTWRAVYSIIDPAVYAVVSRIRKIDISCDQNAVRLGACKLDGARIAFALRSPCTHLRVRARVCTHASHHDECWGSCRPYNSIRWVASPW